MIGLDPVLRETHAGLVKTIKISEAKRNFSKIFARVKRGETIVLQNGRDFVQLVPCAMPDAVPLMPVGTYRRNEEEVAQINASHEDTGPVR